MGNSTLSNSKRIAKNTLFLYFRMLLVMGVTLYTSRVILSALGIVDYGIYSVVGGMALLFAFFTSSLANATQRFLNFELGKNDIEGTKKVFNLSLIVYLSLSITALIAAEIIGLWLLNNKLVIPPERMEAALWVFHATVISLFFTLNGVVFSSVLIARENMKTYAYLGILEALLKLGIAFLLSHSTSDRLKLYALLLLCVTICIQSFYALSAIKKYPECKFHFYWNKSLFKEMFQFIGWNGFSTAVWALNNQGSDILLNIFFGPTINAAKGISAQVNAAVSNFCNNFFTAVQPQIVKSYAKKDFDYFLKLIFTSSRFSVYLLLLLCLPIMFRSEYILNLWLGQFPPETPEFICWILIFSIIDILSNPLWFAIQAVGQLKRYCLIGNLVYLTAFPISFILLHHGQQAVCVFQVLVAVRTVYLFVVFKIVQKYININFSDYTKQVLFPILGVTLCSIPVIYIINEILPQSSFLSLIALCLLFLFFYIIIVYSIGIKKSEKLLIHNHIKNQFFSKNQFN